MRSFKVIPFIFLNLVLISIVFDHAQLYCHPYELVINIDNMPAGASILIKADAQDIVFDENLLYTTNYRNESFYTESSETGFDFCFDQQYGVPGILGYSIYRIRIRFSTFYMDYRDCRYNYGGDPDIYFRYDYLTGEITHNGQVINGTTKTIWGIKGQGPPETFCFKPAVFFYNKFNEDFFGRLWIDESQYVNSGDYIKFDLSTQHSEKPEFQHYLDGSGVPGYNLRHHYWNDLLQDYLISNNFTVENYLQDENGWFEDLVPCTVRTELLSGGSGGGIKFADPWLIEPDGSQPGDFHS